MARPIKNNADYFPHDADMRNDPRVKALRRKFGIGGYGVYCMVIEFLTDSEYFEFKNDSLTLELVAGDFDMDTAELTNILQYCFQLDLFQLEDGVISCKSLENRLSPLLSKRKRDRGDVIDIENTQSKVKESKGKESREKKSTVEESKETFDELFLRAFDEITCERYQMTFGKYIPNLGRELELFRAKCDNAPEDYHKRDIAGLRNAFQYQLKNYKNGKSTGKTIQDKKSELDRLISSKYGTKGAKEQG